MARADILSELLRRASQAAPDLLVADVAAALAEAGGDHITLYVVDYEAETLRPVSLTDGLDVDPGPSLSIAGTMAGRVFQTQEVLSAHTDDGWRVWAPVRERAEQIGVLECGFPAIDAGTLRLCEDLGRLVGHLVRTATRYTDVIEMRRRRRPMNLPAEMQWDMLLPPLAFCCPEVAISGVLEPAYAVGGDAFDYALNGEQLDFAILDAMGHGLSATVASVLGLAGFRYGRRRTLPLADMAAQIDQALMSEFDGEVFVTGHLAQLDTATGQISWINAGHPDPLLLRDGRVVAELHAEPCYPLGLGITVSEIGQTVLERGDMLLFYSDGVIEARPAGGEQFGVARLRDRVERHFSDHLLPAEMLRRLVKDVLGHRHDQLADDATLVLIEWPGRPE